MSTTYKDMRGFKKIHMTCQQAVRDGLNYAWADTCCIDKSSSAELSEAINSMFRWYQRSEKCYVYLSDIVAGPSWRTELTRCRWFTRGWTLQELLAPRHVFFFDRNWELLCEKSECIQEISSITGISESVLNQQVPLFTVPVVQRMSWASSRQTTRIEDEAYSLMGIFNVNMPLLYGEEERAFLRLQEEIMKMAVDLTIFAWTYPKLGDSLQHQETSFSGCLADSPRSFCDLGHLGAAQIQRATSFTTSNQSISFTASMTIQRLPDGLGEMTFLPVCSTSGGQVLGVHMRRCYEDGPFFRQNPYELIPLDLSLQGMILYIGQQFFLPVLPAGEHQHWISANWAISGDFLRMRRSHLCQVQTPPGMVRVDPYPWPEMSWDSEIHAFFADSTSCYTEGTAAVMHFAAANPQIYLTLIILGWDTLDPETLRFSLVDMKQHMDNQKIDLFIQRYQNYDDKHSLGFKFHLQKTGIPRKAAVAHRLDESDLYGLTLATADLVEDETLCRNPFWQFTLSCRLSSWEEIAHIEEYEWQ